MRTTEPLGASSGLTPTPQRPKKKPPVEEILNSFEASLRQVNEMQQQADKAIEALATGEVRDIAQTMIAVEKANLSFELMTQIRNRIVEAYQEIMRMQV